jgi:mannose-1-phosphate guanylyltransferase
LKIVVLAGGVGTRLWPESRQRRPKQLLNLVGSRSMLQETVDRVLPLAPASHVFVVTGRCYGAAVSAQLPDVPRANVIGEPAGRGSAPAMGLAATYLAGDADDVLAFLPADHVVAKPEPFREALKAAEALAREGCLVRANRSATAAASALSAWRDSRRSPVKPLQSTTCAAGSTPGTRGCSL